MMEVTGVSHGAFRIRTRVPADMVTLPADGDWAVWLGLSASTADGQVAPVLVAITVTSFDPPATAPGEALAALARAGNPEPATVIEEFTTPGGHPAVGVRRTVTQRVSGRDVTTGQAQVLAVYPKPRALAVVSGICLHPGDLDRAAALVAGIAARLTVTATAAGGGARAPRPPGRPPPEAARA